MNGTGKIRIRNITELLHSNYVETSTTKKSQRKSKRNKIVHKSLPDDDENEDSGVFTNGTKKTPVTPQKKERASKSQLQKTKNQDNTNENTTITATLATINKRTNRKNQQLPKSQMKIDSYFKISSKLVKEKSSSVFLSSTNTSVMVQKSNKCGDGFTANILPAHIDLDAIQTKDKSLHVRSQRKAKKRLFCEKNADSTKDLGTLAAKQSKNVNNAASGENCNQQVECVIDLCSDSDEENRENIIKPPELRNSPPKTTCVSTTGRKLKKRECPPYKIISGTTFAVDAFQFGSIDGVTVYFLTHFHADHYIGLTKKFQMPIYLTGITARLVQKFIKVDAKYLNNIECNQPVVIDDIEVTAIDANHCPGAIMLLFKFTTGKCILHTGDFRASSDMESEPVFWNNLVDTIYLDTTYISNKYAFKPQSESFSDAIEIITVFKEKHKDKRILYVCGAYLIGKEKFWSNIARTFNLSVWTEDRRKSALAAINNRDLLRLLRDDPIKSEMHVIMMGNLYYQQLKNYFDAYRDYYDILLAIRPSGWEKNSKPQYRGDINIVGVEYSEHSSYNELKRFVGYLRPNQIISTVPVGRDLMKTSTIPSSWYKYDKLGLHRNFQPCITSYLSTKPSTNENSIENSNSNLIESFKSSQVQKEHMSMRVELTNSNVFQNSVEPSDDWLS